MVDDVKTPQSHCLFFDNLFTGYDLLVHLMSIGYRATGTMRENRIKNRPLKTTSLMKKEEGRTTIDLIQKMKFSLLNG